MNEDNDERSMVPEEPRRPQPKPKRRPPRRKKVNDVTPAVVEQILELERKVDGMDGHVRTMVAHILSVDPNDRTNMIAKLTNSDSSSKARKDIDMITSLSDLDDLKFGIKVSSMDHAERRSMWELEAEADPEKAHELLGDGSFPAKAIYEEIELLRKMQTESNVNRTLNMVKAILD